MKVEQLMTRDVISVALDTPLRTVAELLDASAISGLPVCDTNGHVLGIVSAEDVLYKEQGVALESRGVLAWVLEKADGQASRAKARTAGEAMTAPPVTIRAKASVAEAARTMLKRHIHRLPVVERGELVGIVTRSDLVRAFARPDAEIAAEIVEDVLERTLWLDPGAVHVVVAEGEVVLSGEVATRTTADLAPAFVARVPGVVDVRSDLTWRVDDRAVRHSIYADRL